MGSVRVSVRVRKTHFYTASFVSKPSVNKGSIICGENIMNFLEGA